VETTEGSIALVSAIILNKKTGSIYLTIFETRQAKWTETWTQYGMVMMKNMSFHQDA